MSDQVNTYDRRKFLVQAGLGAGVSLFPHVGFGMHDRWKSLNQITVLHTNDTHSHIDPFPSDHRKYAGQGGVEARAAVIHKIRSEEQNVLLLDAGDIFQGTPYFNRYQGVLEMKLMELMGYDAATMGNHDFDAGLEGFLKAKNYARFPFLCANYDFRNTLLDGHTKATQIFEKGGIKVGVFGLGIELNGLVPKKLYGETKVLNPIEIAQDCVTTLETAGCQLIICLSHLGYDYADGRMSDRYLAEQTSGIHLIIGGHTHTFLPSPVVATNAKNEKVLINQVGWAGLNLGRVDFLIDHGRAVKNSNQISIELK